MDGPRRSTKIDVNAEMAGNSSAPKWKVCLERSIVSMSFSNFVSLLFL